MGKDIELVKTVIWWIRRDLRVEENNALLEALQDSEQVIPLFILDPKLLNSSYRSDKRVAFLMEGLRLLDHDLRTFQGRLIVRKGDPKTALTSMLAETNAQAIYAEEDFSTYARERDRQVQDQLPLTLVNGLTVWHPSTVLKKDGSPYTVFTPFSRAWRALPSFGVEIAKISRPRIFVPDEISSDPLPEEPALPNTFPFPPGEAEARRRLMTFIHGEDAPIYRYASRRNRMDLAGTSELSPYLRFGMLSAREAVLAAHQAIADAPNQEASKSAKTWLNELIWREFYYSILYHFPHVRKESFRPEYRSLRWQNDEKDFDSWCEGKTGYPVVDAAMRQLVQIGWMHNRARMIVASFLVKDLLVDWRWGEKWFMQHLIDGDVAANNGGWQWTAGTGTDAAPYFRIFNPVLQSKKFDPDGEYIRRWVPELRNLPTRFIHEPWLMSSTDQTAIGCIIGQNYPSPIIDHRLARERTLEAYALAREGTN
jgi:deoxyribodipyrimidine photo-lyase